MRRSSRLLLIALCTTLVLCGCGSSAVVEDHDSDTSTTERATTSPPSTAAEVKPPESTTSTAAPPTIPTPRPPVIDGLPAPAITFDLDDETTLSLTDNYEPVVLFFWATWCHNCHEMMPLIDEMSADYEGRVTVIAVARLSALHDIETDVIEYLPSGSTRWMSDEDSAISEAFRIPGNPVSILVVGGVETNRWLGMADVADISTRLDEVLDLYD